MVSIPNTNAPTWFRDADWLLFSGSIASEDPAQTVLIPTDNPNLEMFFATQDIAKLYDAFATLHVFVRRYARLGRLLNFAAPRAPSRCAGACGAAGCQCVGNLEICCDTGVAVGGCFGYWAC
jgi:hypothetical protein